MKFVRNLICALFFIPFVFAQTDTTSFLNFETRNYDQKHINLDLQVDFNEEKIFGSCEFTFSPLVNDFKELVLHSESTTVNSVFLKDKNLTFRNDDKHLYISLDKPYKKGDELTVKIDFTSFPARGMYFFKPTKEIPEMPYQVWTQGQGEYNRHWYPAYDLPDDKLTSEIIITVPDSLIAISNGILISENLNSNSTKTFYWKMDQPYSNYLTTLIVGEYTVVKENVRGTILEYNLPEEWVSRMDYFYGRTPNMLNFFSDYITPYPYDRYAQTTVQDFEWGGMENVTATTLNRRIHHDENAIPNYRADDLIAHELAHQWFGDYLTCKTWDHIWLNEGFATYFTDLWLEDYLGVDEFRYERFLSNQSYFNEQIISEPLESIKVPEKNIPSELNDGKAYNRGAAVLNALRFELGDEIFKKGIQHYVNKFRDQVVVTEDFRIAMEEISGKDLKPFFDQWIYGAGFPEFDVSYDWDEFEKRVIVKVRQVQKQYPAVGLFDVPIIIEIISGKEKITDTVRVDKTENVFKYNLNQKPDLVLFNKYGWILCKVNFEKTFNELVYQLQYDDDVLGRHFAAEKLAKFGTDAVPFLRRTLMRELYYGVKLRVVESLKEIGGDNALEPLFFASNDFDARVREAATKALSIYNYVQVGDFLYNKLRNESNHYVIGAALYSYGAIKHPYALDILKEGLKVDSHRNIIRRGVFEGLTKLGDPTAIAWVEEYTKYKYSTGGMHLLDIAALDCAKSFADSHYNQVIDVISSALLNPYFRTRIHAARLLSELKAVEKLPQIRDIFNKDRRIVVKEQLKKFIKNLEAEI